MRARAAHALALALALALVLYGCAPARADAYPRQPGIDAVRYRFALSLAAGTDAIAGEATAEVRFVAAGLTEFWLDLASRSGARGMTVARVVSGGAAVAFEHRGDRLRVVMATAPAAGESREFTVSYGGVPAGGLRAVRNKYGARMVRAENWPDQARQWLPLIDHPSDKASSEFVVTAPAGEQVVANGRLAAETDLGDGRRTTRWVQAVAVPSWHHVIAVGAFAAEFGVGARGIPLQTWLYPRDAALAPGLAGPSARALAFFDDKVGPYPFQKLGAVETVSTFPGMENASAMFFGEGELDGRDLGPLVAHEVAHQWFGASVTQRDWDDVWLSEGFATYFALLFLEADRGPEAFRQGLLQSRDKAFAAEAADPAGTVVHENLADLGRVLSPLIYEKGAWALHMLRCELGDATFWAGARAYYRKYRDGNASTEDFRRVLENASGRDLAWFFDQWLRRGGSPVVAGEWDYDPVAKRARVELTQAQPGAPYRLTLELGLTVAEARAVPAHAVTLEGRSGRFDLPAESAPEAITLDPNVRALVRGQIVRRRR